MEKITGTREKLLALLKEIEVGHEESWASLEDDDRFWDAKNKMETFIESLPDTAGDSEDPLPGDTDITAVWESGGNVSLPDYIRKNTPLTKREWGLVERAVRFTASVITRDKRVFQKALSAMLGGIVVKDCDLKYFRRNYRTGTELILPITDEIIARSQLEGTLTVAADPDSGEVFAAVGDRKFPLGREMPSPECLPGMVRRSMEAAFLNGRSEDYVYADAVLIDRGRLYTVDYTCKSMWYKPWDSKYYYTSDYLNAEKRFRAEHVHGIKGQVRDHWVLYDCITGEQREAKTFTQCRRIAQEMSQKISRYEPYAYAVGMEAFFRKEKIRINTIRKDADGSIIVRGTNADGQDFTADIAEVYIREEDALLPGETSPGGESTSC